ncbi:hypothetical protein OC835_006806 [Tilletia horrida]|nr:hypothetical protein OC835_006806 [Tilletia horrida]
MTAAPATEASAVTAAVKNESRDRTRALIGRLQLARGQLAHMLDLLDPVAASTLRGPHDGHPHHPLPLPELGPGLLQILPLILAPVLQPLYQQQQQQQQQHAAASAAASLPPQGEAPASSGNQQAPDDPVARLGTAINTAINKANELAKVTQDSEAAHAEKRKPVGSTEAAFPHPPHSTPIKLASALLQEGGTGLAKAEQQEDKPLNAILMLRKRKREAEATSRAARRQRTLDAVRHIKATTSIASTTALKSDGKPNASPPALKRRKLHFPAPQLHEAGSVLNPRQMLQTESLQSYLSRLQASARWKLPELAIHSIPALNAGGAQEMNSEEDKSKANRHFTAAPERKITLSIHSSAPSPALARFSTLLGISEPSSSSSASQFSHASAAVLVQIEGVLQALLTLGLCPRGDSNDASSDVEIVVTHANIRSAFEMEPPTSSSVQPQPTANVTSAPNSSNRGTHGASSAHLTSASLLHRSLSSDLMAFLAQERRTRRANSAAGAGDVRAGRQDDREWHELSLALMFVRALRTIEDATVPPPVSLLSVAQAEPGSQTEDVSAQLEDSKPVDETADGARPSSPALLGFAGFLEQEHLADGNDAQETSADADAHEARNALRFGRAPIRWAWCETAAATAQSADEPGVQERDGTHHASGEWLAFNFAAAALAAFPPAGGMVTSAADALLGITPADGFAWPGGPTQPVNGGGLSAALGMGMGVNMGIGMNVNMMNAGMGMGIGMGMGTDASGLGMGMGMNGLGVNMGMGFPPLGLGLGGLGMGLAPPPMPMGMNMNMGLPMPMSMSMLPALGMPMGLPPMSVSMAMPMPMAVNMPAAPVGAGAGMSGLGNGLGMQMGVGTPFGTGHAAA